MTKWLKHIAPSDCGYSENVELAKFLTGKYERVLDYGCGRGRLTQVFDKEDYIGYDPEPELIALAIHDNIGYQYTNIGPLSKDGKDLILAYTVFVHMHDKQVLEVIKQFNPKTICIVEILGRAWRRPKNFPPTFNRSLQDYTRLLGNYNLIKEHKMPHAHYTTKKKKPIYMSYLLWRRK